MNISTSASSMIEFDLRNSHIVPQMEAIAFAKHDIKLLELQTFVVNPMEEETYFKPSLNIK